MNTLRVIAGKYKGMRLEGIQANTTRPTKSILKESLFNVLQNDVAGSIFIEGFGGSGSVGIEALSRGASEAIFIERDHQAFEILKKNTKKLKEEKIRVMHADSFCVLPSIIDGLNSMAILYLDPPFCIRENMKDIYLRCFDLVENIKNAYLNLVIFEHLSECEMPKRLGKFCIIKSKKFGKSTLSYYLKEV